MPSEDPLDPPYFLSTNISDGGRFTLLQPLRDHVTYTFGKDSRRVHWALETSQSLPVITDNNDLTEPNYEMEAEARTLLDGGRLQMPKTIINEVPPKNNADTVHPDIIYIVAHDDMLTGNTHSAYILTEPQAWDLLPNPHPDSIDQDLADQVLSQAPGFLPTPR